MTTNLLALPLPLIFVLSLVFLILGALLGCRLGERATVRGGSTIGTITASILGMLALMIGFTFSMALMRYDARRDALLQEATAIGTTALRARLLPAPYAMESLKLLRDYTQIRLDLAAHAPSEEATAAAIARSNDIQELLWQKAKAVAATNNAMVPTGLYMNTLNDMIDDQERRLTAVRNDVPAIVIWALYVIAVIAVGFTGYAVGLERQFSRVPICILSMIIALVILLIQDLNRPSVGFMRVSQQPILDVAASLEGYTK